MTERRDDEDTGTAQPPGAEPAVPPEAEPAAAEEPAPAAAGPADWSPPGPPPGPASADAAPRRGGLAGALAALALLVALGAAGAVAWLAFGARGDDEALASTRRALEASLDDVRRTLGELGETASTLDGRIAALEAQARERAGRLDDLEDGVDDLRERLDALPPRVASLESAVSSLAGISTSSRRAWLLAEAEHYLEIANAELQLAGDPERALLALDFAEERLRSLEDPALTGVRQALASERRALEAMEMPDLAGVTMTLASLADSVDSLPLASEAVPGEGGESAQPAETSAWRRAVASVKSALSGAISVRRADEEVEPLLSPEAEYFLRENLALRLQIARLALLRGEQAAFEQALADVAAWLRRWFDTESRAVQSALDTIAGIAEADWTVAPPDISTSLRLLRELRERRQAETAGPGQAMDQAPDQDESRPEDQPEADEEPRR
jgi:uroporphyrin-3 C-methyltransferase